MSDQHVVPVSTGREWPMPALRLWRARAQTGLLKQPGTNYTIQQRWCIDDGDGVRYEWRPLPMVTGEDE